MQFFPLYLFLVNWNMSWYKLQLVNISVYITISEKKRTYTLNFNMLCNTTPF